MDIRELQPGRDVAVIVVVASPLCGYLSPSLTGFSVRLEPLGRRLAEMLLAAMPRRYAGPDGPEIIREVWPLTLVERESDEARPWGSKRHSAAIIARGANTGDWT